MAINRRMLLQGALAAAGAGLLRPWAAAAAGSGPLTKPIPGTGEALPAIGLGSWITFNVGNDPKLLRQCVAVMTAFFEQGGGMIDSSPMYGSSQGTIGHGLAQLGFPPSLFSAEKVWTGSPDGAGQIAETRAHWGVPRFDLLQVHNLVAWETHLETLFAMKAAGRLRYVGITTSHGRRHGDVARIMARHPIDFVQVTYNMLDREVESRILPLAQERGIAVIANRPFRRKRLIEQVERHPLPAWVAETGAATWPQFLLTYIVSHPAVTCAIPATSQVAHLRENMATGRGPLPDAALRRRMAAYVEQL